MSVLKLLVEGFESALLPCSLILLLPGLAIGLTARAAAIPALSGFVVGVLGLSWVRFSARGGGFHHGVAATALLLATVLLLVPLIRRMDLVAVVSGLLAGGAAAELWKPCVGEQFGTLLGELPTRGLSGLLLMAAFVVGTLSPLVALGALHHLTPDWILEKLEPYWSVVGATALVLLALATFAGLHDDLVGKLFEWSLNNSTASLGR